MARALKPGEFGKITPGHGGFRCLAVMLDGTRLLVCGKDSAEVELCARVATTTKGMKFDTSRTEPRRINGNGTLAYRWSIKDCEIDRTTLTVTPTHTERKAQKPIQAPWSVEATETNRDGHEAVSEASAASCDVLVDLLDMADDLFRDLEAVGFGCARLAGELVDEIEAELAAA